MASNSEYEQGQFFLQVMTEEERAEIVLKDIIRHKKTKREILKIIL